MAIKQRLMEIFRRNKSSSLEDLVKEQKYFIKDFIRYFSRQNYSKSSNSNIEFNENFVNFARGFLNKIKINEPDVSEFLGCLPTGKEGRNEAIRSLINFFRTLHLGEKLREEILNYVNQSKYELAFNALINSKLNECLDNLFYNCLYEPIYIDKGLYENKFLNDFANKVMPFTNRSFEEKNELARNFLFLFFVPDDFRLEVKMCARILDMKHQLKKIKKGDRYLELERIINSELDEIYRELANLFSPQGGSDIEEDCYPFLGFYLEWKNNIRLQNLSELLGIDNFELEQFGKFTYEYIVTPFKLAVKGIKISMRDVLKNAKLALYNYDRVVVTDNKFTPWLLEDSCESCLDLVYTSPYAYSTAYYLLDKNIDLITIGGFMENKFEETIAKAILFTTKEIPSKKPILLVEGVIGKKNIEKIRLKDEREDLVSLIDDAIIEFAKKKGIDTIAYNTEHGGFLSDKFPHLFVKSIAEKLGYKKGEDFSFQKNDNGVNEFRLIDKCLRNIDYERIPCNLVYKPIGFFSVPHYEVHEISKKIYRGNKILNKETLDKKIIKFINSRIGQANALFYNGEHYSETFFPYVKSIEPENQKPFFNLCQGTCRVIERKI